MKVILLKDHIEGKAGDILDVLPERANYLVRVKAAQYAEKPKLDFNIAPPIPGYENQTAKPKKTKQSKPKLKKK